MSGPYKVLRRGQYAFIDGPGLSAADMPDNSDIGEYELRKEASLMNAAYAAGVRDGLAQHAETTRMLEASVAKVNGGGKC